MLFDIGAYSIYHGGDHCFQRLRLDGIKARLIIVVFCCILDVLQLFHDHVELPRVRFILVLRSSLMIHPGSLFHPVNSRNRVCYIHGHRHAAYSMYWFTVPYI
jgi:hypothetical protein